MQRVKELTDEREKLARDFKDENDELKSKIRALESEVEYLTEELDQRSAAVAAAASASAAAAAAANTPTTPTTPGKSSLYRLKSDASSDGKSSFSLSFFVLF